MNIIKYTLLIEILFFVLLTLSCGTSEKQKEKLLTKNDESVIIPESASIKEEPRDYSEIDYKLPKSNYTYKIKIVGIETILVEDAFTTKADEYSIPTKESGYLLSIKYTMTNPYEKEMMALVPEYYWISSNNGQFFTASTASHRDCQCEIDNQTTNTNEKGMELSKLTEGSCGYGYCLKFMSKETKTFIIKFDDPIYWKVNEIMFHSFGLKSQGVYFTRKTDMPLIIDLKKKTITGVRNF